MTAERCREIHDELRDREEQAHARLWDAVNTVRNELTGLAVKVGVICGIAGAIASAALSFGLRMLVK